MTKPQPLDIGGQAVIEGVLMKNRERLAVAVRLENGMIRIKKETLPSTPHVFKLPLIRGVTTIIVITVIGIKALIWSTNQQLGENNKVSTLEWIGTIALSFFFGMLFFVGIPFFATTFTTLSGLWFTITEGIIRLAVFLGYVYAISFFKDVQRLFQYHGAEHMAANCYEFGDGLTIENVQKYSTIHPRCGTSFIMLVLVISIILFSFITTEIWYYKILWRFVLVPVIAGIAYEVLRLAGKLRSRTIMNIINAPGLWVQKITTQKPTKRMIEVAIASLNAVIR